MSKKDRPNLPQRYGAEQKVPTIWKPDDKVPVQKPDTVLPATRRRQPLALWEAAKRRWEISARAGVVEAQNRLEAALIQLSDNEAALLDSKDRVAWAKAREKSHGMYDEMARESIQTDIQEIKNRRKQAEAEAKNIIQRANTERERLKAEEVASKAERAKQQRKLDAIKNTNIADLIKQKKREIADIDAELATIQPRMQELMMEDLGEATDKEMSKLQDRQATLLRRRGELITELKELTGGVG